MSRAFFSSLPSHILCKLPSCHSAKQPEKFALMEPSQIECIAEIVIAAIPPFQKQPQSVFRIVWRIGVHSWDRLLQQGEVEVFALLIDVVAAVAVEDVDLMWLHPLAH